MVGSGLDDREPLLGADHLHDPLREHHACTDEFQAECERVLMETYDGLNKVVGREYAFNLQLSCSGALHL